MVEIPASGDLFFEVGISEVEKQVQLHPTNPDAHFKKALYLQALGKTDEALSAVKQAINLDPDPDYLFTEASLLYDKQQYELALARISRAQILGGDYPDLWHLMAKLNFLSGNFKLALSEVDMAITKYPDGNYHCTKGQIQWALQDTTAAFNSFLTSVKNREPEYEPLKYLAIISRAMGNYDQAFLYLDQNLKRHQHDPELLLVKGTLYAQIFQFDSAFVVLHKLRNIDSLAWQPLFELALVHFQKRRYDSTLYYTEQSLKLNSQHLASMITQARVYDRRTYYGTALKKYQEILDIDSTYVPAIEELAKLKGKVAYLQKIQQSREENSKIELISPTKPPIRD